jgi:hypothetical protein
MARFANFCDIVLGFVLRSVSGSVVCVFHTCLSSLPNALKTVGSCVSQSYFYAFSSNVPCKDSNFGDQTTSLLAKTPLTLSKEFELCPPRFIRPIYECRSDERLKTKTEQSTRLTYTGLLGELEHVKIKTRLID